MGVLDNPVGLYNSLKEAFANKLIDLAVNSLVGTRAQFNLAMTDDDFATLNGVETLTNKTFILPSITGVTTLDIGNADTTISRAAAGRIAVEGVPVADALDVPFDLTNGEASMPRTLVNSASQSMTNGLIRYTCFTAKKTEPITQVATTTGATPQVGATLCRIGIYSVDASDNLVALLASTANDTTLWLAASTRYVKSLSSTWNKVRGNRYAVGVLEVGTSQQALLAGTVGPVSAIAAQVPRLCGTQSSQTDLPSSGSPVVAVGSLAASNIMIYVELLP